MKKVLIILFTVLCVVCVGIDIWCVMVYKLGDEKLVSNTVELDLLETADGDVIAIRHMMYLTMSYDHRVIDGALGGSFLRRVGDYLEKWDKDREI